jgi:hypothetical protein
MLHAKRWLYLVHRWLGVLLCAFFAMWFVSGVVMMYVGYPKLTQAERLAHLPPLRSTTLGPERLLEPADALTRAGLVGPLQDLRLAVASGGRAVYLVVLAAPTGDAAPRPRRAPAPAVIDALTGERLQHVDATHAIA